MSVIEPHLSDLRGGFGGYGFSSRVGLGSGPMLPLWRPTPTPAVSYCTSPTCPCSLPRPYIMSDLYDYPPGFSYSWAAWYYKSAQDPLYKGLPPLPPPPIERHDYEHRESPSKELPTKAHKQERLKERVELSQPLNFDKDHALKHRQVCTGTQTQISSVSPPNHYRTEESSSAESYSAYHHLLTQTVTSHQNLRNSSPQFAHSDLHNHHDAPLNLSLTNSSANSNSPSQSRPSVITCAPLVTNGRYENGSNGSPSPSGRREVNSADDQDIEEHFRRSLGKNYTEFLTKPASTPSPPQPAMLPSPPPPPPPPPTLPPLPPYHSVVPTLITNNLPGGKENPNVSITGSVDDHFARALGNRTWSELKAKNDIEATQPGSVDDHFAKALGDTWLKIKAEKESSRPNHPFPISHQLPPHPHPLPHPIPHPHPHVLPLPQRSPPPTTQHSTSLLST